MTVECDHARMLIHLRLDGELPAGDADLLARHLERCAECRALDEQLRRVDAALRAGLASGEPAADFAARVRRQFETARRVRPVWATWLPAAAVFLIAAIGLLVVGPRLRGPQAPAAPAVVVSGGDAIHLFEPDEKVAQPAHTGAALPEESVAWGMGGSAIVLQFAAGARVRLSDEAVVRVRRDALDLFKGDLHADLSEVTEPFTVATPWAVIEGEGASFRLRSIPGGEGGELMVDAGKVTVRRQGISTTVAAGASVRLGPDPDRTFVL